jgi:hypothetical protein
MSKKGKVIAALVGATALTLGSAISATAYPVAAGHGTLQEVPTPASASCADYMSPVAVNWSGVGASSWASTFGGKCVRTMFFDNGRQGWYVR